MVLQVHPYRRLLLAFTVLIGFGASTHASPVKFDIPAQPAPAALQAFITQSGHEVLYPHADLRSIRSKRVFGEFEPAAALNELLGGSGFLVTAQGSRKFLVSSPKSDRPGSIEGQVRDESGKPVAGAKVSLSGSDTFTHTDRRGRFLLEEIPAGAQVLVISADGLQQTKVTDVFVGAAHRQTLGVIVIPARSVGVMQLDDYIVSARRNDGVIELDPFEVQGGRAKPFSDRNVDLVRTINDAQPYYIFDQKVIERSGAINVEDFLKQRLTMNATALTSAQTATNVAGSDGSLSSIDLRGLGADKTLILVNGRRQAGVSIGTTSYQPDLNGISMSAIDRIEVLPSSASGIYGGSAIGGVVNVILKQDYAGGEIRATYDNTWGLDMPRRTLSATYGMSLEEGRTHVMVNASYSDGKPLYLQDRREIYEERVERVVANNPSGFFNLTTIPYLGSLPNITTVTSLSTLTLKDGSVIPSRRAYVPAGVSPTTSMAELSAALRAAGGTWNLDLPSSTQSPTGLLRQFGATPQVTTFQLAVRRQMLANVELFAEYAEGTNRGESSYNPYDTPFAFGAAFPQNPFNQTVYVRFPDSRELPTSVDALTRNFAAGAVVQLPFQWRGMLDYARAENRVRSDYFTHDLRAREADGRAGILNPFVDTLAYPLELDRYMVNQAFRGRSMLDTVAVRGSGPVPGLPWSQAANLTLGFEHRIAAKPTGTTTAVYPTTVADSRIITYFEQEQTIRSGYGEIILPLIPSTGRAFLHGLDLQLAVRSERYEVSGGTSSSNYFPATGIVNFSGPVLNGQPYFTTTSYASTNGTVGFRYQPVPDVTIRASRATAFLPPTTAQLVQNPMPSTFTTPVNDPITGRTNVPVYTLGGGNPSLQPQSSESYNFGVVWQPSAPLLQGLRMNVEYYRVAQDDYMDALSAQQIVTFEALYPDRVTRDSSNTITLVDTSLLNLYQRLTAGWDLSADYVRKLGRGTLRLSAAQTVIVKLQNQYSLTAPAYDAVNFPAEGGAAKYRAIYSVDWERDGFSVGWTYRHIGSYQQYGAAGGPISVRSYNGTGGDTSYTSSQGGDSVAAQGYHDAVIGYSFAVLDRGKGERRSGVAKSLLGGLAVQAGVRNVFDKVPPFDAYYSRSFYMSPYGDARLRTYWVSVRKAF